MPEHRVLPVELHSPVNEWVRAFNTGNVAAIVALYTEDAELNDSGMPRVRRGQREIESWFALRFRSMPTNIYTPTSQKWRADGEIWLTWTLYGRGPRLLEQAWLSRPFQVDGVSRFRLRAGQICWQEGTYDHLAVLKQIVPLFKWCPEALTRFVYSLYMRLHGQM